MLALFTDFGLEGPYTGQMKAVLHRDAPGVPVVDLCADAPMFDPMASAWLLASLVPWLPAGTVVVGVVDPGVGSDRGTVMMEADRRWFVGPDNGLFATVARRAESGAAYPTFAVDGPLSASFHGRDLFAPVAARLARGERPDRAGARPLASVDRPDWPDDLARIVYVDHYGNAMTGLWADHMDPAAEIIVQGRPLRRARTFSDALAGEAFWYANSQGLVELAVNQGRADRVLGVRAGDPVHARVSTAAPPGHD